MDLKEKLISSFLAFENQTDLDSPIHDVRCEAIKTFEEKGFPSKRDEAWKYTSLNSVLKAGAISQQYKKIIADRKQAPIQATATDVAEVKSLLDTMNISDPSAIESDTISNIKRNAIQKYGPEFLNGKTIRLSCRAKVKGDVVIAPFES